MAVTDSRGITGFTLARIGEVEAVARAAAPGPWLRGTEREHLVDDVMYGQSTVWPGHIAQVCNFEYAAEREGNAAHIARHDPRFVLTWCEFLRWQVGVHHRAPGNWAGSPPGGFCAGCLSDIESYHSNMPWPCETARRIAGLFRYQPDGTQHPEWKDGWAHELQPPG